MCTKALVSTFYLFSKNPDNYCATSPDNKVFKLTSSIGSININMSEQMV